MPFCIGTPNYGEQATDYVDALQKLVAFLDEDNNYVATVAVNSGGSGWAVDDYFEISGGTAEQGLTAVGRVTSVSSGVVTGVEMASMGAYSVDPTLTGASTSAVSPASGTGLTVDLTMDSLDYVVELDQVYDTTEREVFLQGIGLDDSQNIYFGIRTHRDIQEDTYNWEVVGATGYNGALAWDGQPGSDNDVTNSEFPSADIPLLNSTIPYWFYANKQRVVLVMRASTVYLHGYLGFGLPFGPLSLYPYPLVWAGSAPGNSRIPTPIRFSESTDVLNNYLDPARGACFFRWVDGNNHVVEHHNETGGSDSDNPRCFPHRSEPSANVGGDPAYSQTLSGWASNGIDWLQKFRDHGGEYPLLPIFFWNQEQFVSYVCQLDRVYWIPGFSLTSEDTVEVDSTKYRVFQNCDETGREHFIAIQEV